MIVTLKRPAPDGTREVVLRIGTKRYTINIHPSRRKKPAGVQSIADRGLQGGFEIEDVGERDRNRPGR